MAISIANNVASLTAQNNLSRTSSMLSTTLQRLSSGLKINSGADGPAALVISQLEQAQMAGLQTAIDNTSKAADMVQTTEGALGEINSLLVQIRSLALDSANSGVNDANSLAANQAQIANALSTIDRIAANTQFNGKNVLDGSAGMTGTTDTTTVTFLAAATTAPTGTFAVNVTTAAQRANVTAGTAQANPLAQDETLTVNGVSIGLTAGQTQAQVISTINQYSGQTGVTAEVGSGGATELHTTQFGSASKITVQSNVAAGASSSGFGTTSVTASGVDVAGTIGGFAATGNGNVLTGTAGGGAAGISVAVALNPATAATYTAGTAQTGALAANENLTINGHVIALTAGQTQTQVIAAINAVTATTHVTAKVGTGGATELDSTGTGSGATISVQSDTAAGATSSGFGTTAHNAAGVDTSTTTTATGAQGNVTVTDNSLVFQIGANAHQTASIAVASAASKALGLNVTGDQFANLSQIDVRSQSGAQDSIKIIDQAISDISSLRGNLGAFQAQTLQSTQNNMRTTLQNTTAAESTITDTDFAAETANLTKYQVMSQAGGTVLSQANQTSQLVLSLLRGQ